MNMKKILSAVALIAIGVTAFMPTHAMAQIGVNIVIGTPPPPPRYEIVPPPRIGYIWVPGYWDWDGRRHAWAAGHWEQSRSGYLYDRPQWREGRNGWELRRGGWHRGKDRGDYRRDHDNRDDEYRNHCPPGQAKKGNC